MKANRATILGVGVILTLIISLGAYIYSNRGQAFGAPISAVWVLRSTSVDQQTIWQKIKDAYNKVQSIVATSLADRALTMFMNNLAYDLATELATGGPGGTPQFRISSITDSIGKAQDAAIGEFIGDISQKQFSELGLNLCDPSVSVKLTLTLSLIDETAPPATPKCNWRQVQQNWQRFGEGLSTDLIKFQLDPRRGADNFSTFFDSFSGGQSDLGVYTRLRAELNNRQQIELLALGLNASECQGFLDKKTTITEQVKTHCRAILSLSEAQWEAAIQGDIARQSNLGSGADTKSISRIMRDAGQLFINTFTSKLMKRWIQRGMWSLTDILGRDGNQSLREELLAQLRGGSNITNPRNYDIFNDFRSITIERLEDYSYLEQFVICPSDPQYRTPDNCTLDQDLFLAITGRKTLQEAIDEGIVSGDTPIYSPQDDLRNNTDDCFREGLCYHNLVKLRKANIIPVGWELAARRSPLTSPVTLQEAINCFEDDPEKCSFGASDTYAIDGDPKNPFYHLIDGNWVLKAPQAICEGYVYSSVVESPESANRQQYCADVKVCLREDDEGNCLDGQYGYCTRSENIWRFQGDICTDGEIYAGCLTYVNPEIGTDSYIEGSLDFCDSSQVGCRRYSTQSTADGTWLFPDPDSDPTDVYLNGRTEDCSGSDAGCDEFVVASPPAGQTFGPNIYPNPDFEEDRDGDGAPDGAENAYGGNRVYLQNDAQCIFGNDCVQITSTGGYIGVTKIFEVVPGTYNLSAYASFTSNSGGSELYVHLGDCELDPNCTAPTYPIWPVRANGTNSSSWNRVDQSWTFGENTRYVQAYVGTDIAAAGDVVLIDNIQLQMVSDEIINASNWRDYGVGGKVYMNENTVMCTLDEVGCQGYLPANGDPMIPAVIDDADLCPSECVGYSTFAQELTYFDNQEGVVANEYHNFIPDTADQCPAIDAGCSEFTNLDEVALGGEGIEYYSYVRQCVDQSRGQTYYTWEGSDTVGYQLRTWFALPSDLNIGGGLAPCTNLTGPGQNTCDDNPAGTLLGDCTADQANPDCRQFIDTNGNSWWRYQSMVVFASDDCHPLRRTESDTLYNGIPAFSNSCAPENNGCREYTGNTGNNIQNIFTDRFENGTFAPWTAFGGGQLSNESLQNNGHSFRVNTDSIAIRFLNTNALVSGKEVELEFWMKSNVFLNNIDIQLLGNYNAGGSFVWQFNNPSAPEATNIESGNWNIYSFSNTLPDISNVDPTSLALRIVSFDGGTAGQVFYDNVVLSTITDSLYVVKNSWETPISCDTPFTGFHLGCQQYTDTNGQTFNLKSFNRLCREEAIGCSMAIETHNSTYEFDEIFNLSDNSEITVPADEVVYLVPDSDNYCASIYKGCTELGVQDINDPTRAETVYKINDPDQYGQILCDYDGLNCEAFNSDKGSQYFKHPGPQTCTYQENVQAGPELLTGWWQTQTLVTGPPLGCGDTDGYTDILQAPLETNELVLLGSNNPGLCPASKNGCTEFIDPTDPPFRPPGYNSDNGCSIGPVDPEVDGLCQNSSFTTRTACENVGLQWYVKPKCEAYYYFDNDKIDESGCLGQVDQVGGCALFYDSNNWNAEHTAVIADWDTKATYDVNVATGQPQSPITCGPSLCTVGLNFCDSDADCVAGPTDMCITSPPGCVRDSNRLVRVQADRQCAEWLSCKSSSSVWDPDANQFRVLCDDLDSCVEFGSDNNITNCKDFDAIAFGGILESDLAFPTSTKPLTIPNYQERISGENDHIQWSDIEYTGYSIPDMLPIRSMEVYDFGLNNAAEVPRLVYPVTNSTDSTGRPVYTPTCYDGVNDVDGVACSATIDGYNFNGECQEGICWVAPRVDSDASLYALETRGYASPDAPFPQSISPNYGTTRAPDVLTAYGFANLCETNATDDAGGSCEIEFVKHTYSQAGQVLYYPKNYPAPEAVCSSGQVLTNLGLPKDCYVVGVGPSNSACDTTPGAGDGLCSIKTREETFRNWTGICVEDDLSTRLVADEGANFYCNQWYGVDKVVGTNSLYDNYNEAGYFESNGRDALFCAAGEPYQVPEDRVYCGKYTNIGGESYCSVLIRVPAGTKIASSALSGDPSAIFEGYILEGEGNDTPATYVHVGETEYPDFVRALDESNASPYTSDWLNQGLVGGFTSDGGATAGFGVAWIKNGHLAMNGVAQSDCDSPSLWGSCSCRDNRADSARDTMMFKPVDFNDHFIDFTTISGVFDANDVTGSVEIYFYDEEINMAGQYDASAGIVVPIATNKFVSHNDSQAENQGIGHKHGQYDSGNGSCNDLEGCAHNTHEASWTNMEGAGGPGNDHRSCNPLPYNFYVKVDSSFQPAQYVAWENSGCAAWPLPNGVPTPLELSHAPFAANCFTNQSVQSTNGIDCDAGNNPNGCMQQCSLVSQLDAVGERTLVKTDLWWRAEGGDRVNNWLSYYFSGTGFVQNSNVQYDTITGEAGTDFTHFGAPTTYTFTSNPTEPVVVRIPAATEQIPGVTHTAATYYARENVFAEWSEAQNALGYLFAKVYNWKWDPALVTYRDYNGGPPFGAFDFAGDRAIFPGVDANVNPFAGPDYPPYILKVCEGDLAPDTCDDPGGGPNAAQGFTINNINDQDVYGREELFVALKFYYHAHPDHMPVRNLEIDWDGSIGPASPISNPGKYKNSLPLCDSDLATPGDSSSIQGFGGTDDACRQGYKVFYNVYKYDTNYLCDGSNGSPIIGGASCYRPTVTVRDNWSQPATNPLTPAGVIPSFFTSQSVDFTALDGSDLWIIVYRE